MWQIDGEEDCVLTWGGLMDITDELNICKGYLLETMEENQNAIPND